MIYMICNREGVSIFVWFEWYGYFSRIIIYYNYAKSACCKINT